MSFSSTLQPNLFQVLNPMGGTGARTGAAASAAVGAAGGSFVVLPGPHAVRMARARRAANAATRVILEILLVIMALSLDERSSGL
jgi:hypothetical protein